MNEYERVVEELRGLTDDKFREFSSKIVVGSRPLLGVRVPLVKRVAKSVSRETIGEYFENCEFKYFEDTLVYGLLTARLDYDDFLDRLPLYLDKADSWALVDSFVPAIKCVNAHRQEIFECIRSKIFSAENFELRFYVIVLMDWFLEEKIQFILKSLEKIDGKGYYNDMAIAWLLSVAFVKRKVETLEYLKRDGLSDFTHNKAISKICDSFRVNDEDKIEIKKLLRKR